MVDPAPIDQRDRDRIAGELGDTLFVEAGAGTGKTRSLVERVVSLVGSGVPVDHIAAITFTEAAAAELRDRLRGALVDAGHDLAAADLDGAAVCTLHAFAQRILSEHPIEIGLPPAVEVLDEVSSQLAFDERWTGFVDALYDDPDEEATLLRARAADVKPWALEALARTFNDNWDLLADRPLPAAELTPIDVGPVVDAFFTCRDLARAHAQPDDSLRRGVDEIEPRVVRLAESDDDIEIIELLRSKLKPSYRGAKGQWDDPDLLEQARAARERIGAEADEALATIRDEVIRRLAARVARFTLEAAGQRRAEGRLEFHDLLVLARDLLRTRPEARRALHLKYERLLIDEFQDTDPIQIELAARIAASGDGGDDWTAVPIDPERLFFVGDPKQSIYRFRRADIRLFLEARRRFAGDEPVALVENFRTVPEIVEWVNGLFEHLMVAGDGQPEYQRLHAYRRDPRRGPTPVTILGRPHEDLKAGEIRDLEAADVASTIVSVIEDGWEVVDGDRARPARLDEIAVLVPSRLCLPALETALDRANVPFRAETRSLVWASREVRDLVTVLRAVDDPANVISVVAALRSPAFGCGDDDLLVWRRSGGGWDYRQPPPDALPSDHPVATAMRSLDDLHRRHWWLSTSAVVETVARERRLFEFGLVEARPRDAWRRLRWVVDQARAFTDARQGSLREFLDWAQRQEADTARVAEPVLPESDDDAVRILTIHGAKGREFPICILTGMSTVHRPARRGPQVLWPVGRPPEISLRRDVETDGFSAEAEAEEQMSAEELIRLLYVGVTRARDHLVVSVHHKAKAASFGRDVWTHLDRLDGWTEGAPADDRVLPPGRPTASPPETGDADLFRRRAAALAAEAASAPVSATELAGELRGGPAPPDTDETRDRAAESVDDVLESTADERPPGLVPPGERTVRPRSGGTSLGRAVHAVLQDVGFDGLDLEPLAESAAADEGIPELAEEVAARARAALDADIVRMAATVPHWRELYVAAPIEDRLVEGYVDLLVRTERGLVVVDYKTDAVADDAAIDTALANYAPQGAAYALAVGSTTGEAVVGCAFVFLTPDGAIERWVDDLDDVCRRVRVGIAAVDSA